MFHRNAHPFAVLVFIVLVALGCNAFSSSAFAQDSNTSSLARPFALQEPAPSPRKRIGSLRPDQPFLRIPSEILFGSFAGLGVPAFLLGASALGQGFHNGRTVEAMAYGTGFFAMSFMPLMVTAGGELAGGRGNLLGAQFGALAGGALAGAFSLVMVATQEEKVWAPAAGVAAVVAPLIGAIVGYEMWDQSARNADNEDDFTSNISTNLTIGPDGGMLQVSGSF